MRCPICKNPSVGGGYTVGVWVATNGNTFGLGTKDSDGQICCSFREGEFATMKEAQEVAENTSVEEVQHEYDYQEDEYEDNQEVDSDPYDVDVDHYQEQNDFAHDDDYQYDNDCDFNMHDC